MQKTNNDSNKNEEKKDKAPLWLWIVIGLLVGLFIVWSLFLGLWSFIIVVTFWLILIIVLKKTTISLLWSVLLVCFVLIFSLFYLMRFAGSGNNNENSAKNTQNLPKLEMTIAKSPEVINCDDEVSNIEVKATNVGNKDLTFAEVKSGKYDFGICDAEKTDSTSCFPLADGYVSVNDFDSIKVGETKTIVFTTPAKYDNAITSFPKAKVNGEYKYYINFSQIKNPKLKPTLSKSDVFAVKTNIMNPANEYIKVDCRKN